MTNIKLTHKDFNVHFIGNKSNNISNTNIEGHRNRINFNGIIDHEVVALKGLVKTYNERMFYSGNSIIISSNKFFNKIKCIFTKKN